MTNENGDNTKNGDNSLTKSIIYTTLSLLTHISCTLASSSLEKNHKITNKSPKLSNKIYIHILSNQNHGKLHRNL